MNFKKISPWIYLAIIGRLIIAATQVSTSHPDEWFQTVEFGNYIAHGFLSRTQEFMLHMRNLLWPALLAVPLKISHFVSPESIFLRFYLVKLLTALLDLIILWGSIQLYRSEYPSQKKIPHLLWGLLVFPAISLMESVRPSQEHLSSIGLWLTLGWVALPKQKQCGWWRSFFVGAAIVLTGTFRYPSALLGLGAGIGILKNKQVRKLPFYLGAGLNLHLAGMFDWHYYGVHWESSWMYLQYNIFAGISHQQFGSQTAIEYLKYFGQFGGLLLPLGLFLLIFAPVGFYEGIKKYRPWAWAALCYLVGHLLVSHKEPRFMAPLLPLVFWASFVGFTELKDRMKLQNFFLQPAARGLWIALLIPLSLAHLKAIWGETWKAPTQYLSLGKILDRNSHCAVITLRRPLATLLPWSAGNVPSPALGFFPAPNHENSSDHMKDTPVIWVTQAPQCNEAASRVLFQPRRAEEIFVSVYGCIIQKTGILSFFPESYWSLLQQKGWINGPWYDCPSQFLSQFTKTEVRQVIETRLRKHRHLLAIAKNPSEFLARGYDGIDYQSPDYKDGTFPEW